MVNKFAVGSGNTHLAIGALLRTLREQRGIRLWRMAASIGVSPAYLSKFERGKSPSPSNKKLRLIARVLHQDADELMAEKRSGKARPPRTLPPSL